MGDAFGRVQNDRPAGRRNDDDRAVVAANAVKGAEIDRYAGVALRTGLVRRHACREDHAERYRTQQARHTTHPHGRRLRGDRNYLAHRYPPRARTATRLAPAEKSIQLTLALLVVTPDQASNP